MSNIWLKIKSILTMAPIVILIEDGKARRVRGNISNSLINDFTELAGANDIDQGLITILDDGGDQVLNFSGPFDGVAEQRFRNVWFAQSERRMMKV